MTDINPFVHEYWVDLKKGLPIEREKKPLSQGDAYADKFVVRVQEAGKDVDLSGVGVSAKVIRYDGQTVPLVGAVENGAACVTLDASCYTVPGEIRVTIALSAGDMVQSVLVVMLNVETSQTSVIVDNGVIGDLSGLLSAIADMKDATQDARDAVEAIDDALKRGAPAIYATASGEVANCTDASARDALSVVSHITAVQEGEGDPSAANIRPITSRLAVGLWHGAEYDANSAGKMSAALPEEVYGGTLDWATGLLTVTHKMVTLTSASGYWGTGSKNYWIEIDDRSEDSTLLSNRFVTTTRVATQMLDGQMRLSGTYPRVVFANPDNALSIDEWKAQIDASPIQLVYELAEPYTIQLDPHTVTMLRGSNAMWSDTGETTVTYIADTKMYIDNALAAIAAAIINQ